MKILRMIKSLYLQLFEKLSLQETSECAESVKKQPAASPKETPESRSSSPAVGVRGDSRTADSDLSGAAETEKDAHKTLLVVQSPQARQKKETKTYGKVHTRHINQLFIRGENVILVNPQPLWFSLLHWSRATMQGFLEHSALTSTDKF